MYVISQSHWSLLVPPSWLEPTLDCPLVVSWASNAAQLSTPQHSRATHPEELVYPGERLHGGYGGVEGGEAHRVVEVVGLAAIGKRLKKVFGCLKSWETFSPSVYMQGGTVRVCVNI